MVDELDPASQDAGLFFFIYYLVPMQRPDEAGPMLRRMLERDPLSPSLHSSLGSHFLHSHMADRAIEHLQRALKLDPNYPAAHNLLGPVYLWTGRLDEGIRALENFAQAQTHDPMTTGLLGFAYALTGHVDQARKDLRKLQGFVLKSYVPPSAFGMIHYALGEMDPAFDWFDKAADEHSAGALFAAYPQSDHESFVLPPALPRPAAQDESRAVIASGAVPFSAIKRCPISDTIRPPT